MSKERERNVEILEHRIAELELKILAFQVQNISDRKIELLEMKKMRYESQLEEIMLT